MATDIATFRIRFPEFEDDTLYPDARVQLFLDDAAAIMGSDEMRWCGQYDIAQAYLAAHLLTVGTNSEMGDVNARTGPVVEKTAGGVSVKRSQDTKVRSEGDSFYMGTVYGQRFIIIRNNCFVGVVVTNCL